MQQQLLDYGIDLDLDPGVRQRVELFDR